METQNNNFIQFFALVCEYDSNRCGYERAANLFEYILNKRFVALKSAIIYRELYMPSSISSKLDFIFDDGKRIYIDVANGIELAEYINKNNLELVYFSFDKFEPVWNQWFEQYSKQHFETNLWQQ